MEALPQLQPILVLQMLIGLSQLLNGGITAQAPAVARALILDSQQRLRRLRKMAPHPDLPWDQIRSVIPDSQQRLHNLRTAAPVLVLSWEQILQWIRPKQAADEHISAEESTVQAMLQLCLGLLLRWLSQEDDRTHPGTSSIQTACLAPVGVVLPIPFSSLHPLLRARSCLIS